jgi:hypothetical protein
MELLLGRATDGGSGGVGGTFMVIGGCPSRPSGERPIPATAHDNPSRFPGAIDRGVDRPAYRVLVRILGERLRLDVRRGRSLIVGLVWELPLRAGVSSRPGMAGGVVRDSASRWRLALWKPKVTPPDPARGEDRKSRVRRPHSLRAAGRWSPGRRSCPVSRTRRGSRWPRATVGRDTSSVPGQTATDRKTHVAMSSSA